MAERVALVLVVGLLVWVTVVGIRRWNAGRTLRVKLGRPDWGALGAEPDSRRTLIAFSTPSCAACHQAQAPAIERVRDRFGEDSVRVIRVDAASQPAVASAFGILTVPATVVVAAGGERIVAVNQGFVASGRLAQQLELG